MEAPGWSPLTPPVEKSLSFYVFIFIPLSMNFGGVSKLPVGRRFQAHEMSRELHAAQGTGEVWLILPS